MSAQKGNITQIIDWLPAPKAEQPDLLSYHEELYKMIDSERDGYTEARYDNSRLVKSFITEFLP